MNNIHDKQILHGNLDEQEALEAYEEAFMQELPFVQNVGNPEAINGHYHDSMNTHMMEVNGKQGEIGGQTNE